MSNASSAKGNPAVSAEDIRSCCLEVVYPYVLRRVGQVEDAEDLASDVFAAAWSCSAYPRPEHLKFWLLGIARRKVADYHRRNGMRRSHLQASAYTASPQDGQLLSTVRDLVRELPEPQREALLMYAVDDLSVDEIAQVMRKSVSAVNSLIRRARVRLRHRAGVVAGIDLARSDA